MTSINRPMEFGAIMRGLAERLSRLESRVTKGEDTGWKNPTMLNSWVAYDGIHADPRYRKIDGVVWIQGLIKGGASVSVMFNLPVGYRPTRKLIFVCNSNGGACRVDVTAGGDVQGEGTNTTWTSIQICFPADQ